MKRHFTYHNGFSKLWIPLALLLIVGNYTACRSEGKTGADTPAATTTDPLPSWNEGGHGDIAMLKYSQGSKYPSFQLLVNHDDSLREYYYQEKDNLSLNTAAERQWHVISMKNDWKTVFVDKK